MQGRRCAGQPQLLEPSLIQDDPGFTDKCECQVPLSGTTTVRRLTPA